MATATPPSGSASMQIGWRQFVVAAFEHAGLSEHDAQVSARGLILADLRGHESHGVSSALFGYLEGLRTGDINARPDIRIVQDSAAITRWDGDLGHGYVVGERVMQEVIRRADRYGCAFAAVGRSRHYGMAQYYSLMALEHDQIGFSMTNSHGAGVTPFGGAKSIYETNPITIAAPAGDEAPFVLDMATSTAAAGKIGVAARDHAPIPPTWALGTDGRPTTDPDDALAALTLLPLGATKEGGGHKGSGLALWVDLMCGALSMRGFHGATDDPTEVNHFFGAWKIEAFGPLERVPHAGRREAAPDPRDAAARGVRARHARRPARIRAAARA